MQNLDLSPSHLFWFFIEAIIIRGILSRKVAEFIDRHFFKPLGKKIMGVLVRTEREAAIWMHNKNRAMNKGHNHKNIWECEEDACMWF